MSIVGIEDVRKVARTLAEKNVRLAVHAVLEFLVNRVNDVTPPKMIVELGVSREALMNKVLSVIAEDNNAQMLSIDLYDFSEVCKYNRWRFMRGDARVMWEWYQNERFAAIDLLVIDLDEKYDTTRRVIQGWGQLLAPTAQIMFRCSNLAKILMYVDGSSTNLGWDNERGVIRAIEDEFKVKFDETKQYSGIQNGWHVDHIPWGAGLTVMRREIQ